MLYNSISHSFRRSRPASSRHALATSLAVCFAAIVAGCASSDPAVSANSAANSPANSPAGVGSKPAAVTLVTHNSFSVDPKVLADFEVANNLTVTVLAQDALANQLVLTKDNPLGDVSYGIDNTFASRAVQAGVFSPYTSPLLPMGSDKYAFDADNSLTAVDFGDVCVNVDHAWFSAKGLAEPTSLEDLIKPEYKNLLVGQSAATSSTGLAFLLATIGHSGVDGWQKYWTALKANGIKIEADWESSYNVDFSGSSGKGDRPLVVSYGSSPPAEAPPGAATAPTGIVAGTCFRQVEYVGVLAGAKNPQAAHKVVDFMLSPEFQAGLPQQMYVYPVDKATTLPADWVKFAQAPADTIALDPVLISKDRDVWIQDWSDLVEG
ncbi:thiamine ABC transporter substrate-binding protein [Nakamurella antarctica]|uniref:Thiamine ABC transporter substrate-binding protein n=1 Tax=Nakamurella antarctica TaxID=1902245 RepID=A0A3G8ZTS1_9ACTN|nr:thiamine ABC transporter substrate-binding protein [Nakamurella antarctica]AZI57436.1 thiamine ABC transporter substrate-binding protein [Nakamurella antarctica]